MFHLNLVLVKLSHDPSFHLFCFKLKVFSNELFLLQQFQLLGLLQLEDLLRNLAVSISVHLLSEGLHLPLVRLIDFINLLSLAPLEGLANNLELEFPCLYCLLVRSLVRSLVLVEVLEG